MIHLHYIAITVRYESRLVRGRSLGRIAPELKDAGLSLIEDRLDDPQPSRTWAGYVDGPTYKRFATAWRLPAGEEGHEPCLRGRDDNNVLEQTFDGMNWEVNGTSPIVSVSVRAVRFDSARQRLRRRITGSGCSGVRSRPAAWARTARSGLSTVDTGVSASPSRPRPRA
jgi:hypothetical protein